MILYPVPNGWVAVRQSAHALLSFQLADHWGNRTTPRPAPRADVLAAVLLHDVGWDDREEPPRLASDGSPLAFDTLPEDEREALWSAAVERAAIRGRYVAYLVSHHVSQLAARYSTTPHPAFLATEAERCAALVGDLAADPRYRAALAPAADAANRAVVHLTDAIAVHLLRGETAPCDLGALPWREDGAVLTLEPAGMNAYRLSPWPLAGRRLTVHTEGRRLPTRTFADEGALSRAWTAAMTVRLSWTLLPPGAPRP